MKLLDQHVQLYFYSCYFCNVCLDNIFGIEFLTCLFLENYSFSFHQYPPLSNNQKNLLLYGKCCPLLTKNHLY